MAKKTTKNKQTKAEDDRKQVVVDGYARVLQMVAIVGVVILVIAGQIIPNADIPIWVPAGLLGVAIGLSPEQIGNIIKNMFTGVKK
jgi:hypothetical protein